MTTASNATLTGSPARDGASVLAGLRVLVVHEWLYAWAGAERVLEHLLGIVPQADVLVGVVTPQMRREHPIAARAMESWVGRVPGARTHHRWFLPLHAAAFAAHDTSGYDLVISISHAFEKAVRARRRGAVHLSYCLSPPRYLWDLSDAHSAMASPIQRLALALGRTPARAIDRAIAARVDRFVSLSRAVAARVQRAYGRSSAVVYPPVTAKPTDPSSTREGFLLTIGRLVPYKRVDLAIAAANRMGLPLVVAGDGPERARLERLSGPTVRFTGFVSDEAAGRLLSTCSAFMFCGEEDFGIAPVEANAHGTPVVAYGRGGVVETMERDRTAILFDEQTVDSVAAAVDRCLSSTWDAADLRANAARFGPERFRAGMTSEILRCLEDR